MKPFIFHSSFSFTVLKDEMEAVILLCFMEERPKGVNDNRIFSCS